MKLCFLPFMALITVFLTEERAFGQQYPSPPPGQSYFAVTDSAPALVNGLQAGYIVTGESTKEVGKKGNFSRYTLRFYITNTTNETRVLRNRDWANPNQPGALLVRFTCLNATGARLTSTECSLSASPFSGEEWVDDRDEHGRNIRVKKTINLGYGIRPGETISTNTIMIVPLDQRPQVTATFYPAASHYLAYIPEAAPPPPPAYVPQSGSSVVWLQNTATGTYLNTPNGQVGCNGVNHNAWGCEWEMLPVSGTNYFLIRNRLQNKFLSTDGAGLLSENSQSQAAYWTIEQSYNSPTCRIRNAMNNATLVVQNGAVIVGNSQDNTGFWLIEH